MITQEAKTLQLSDLPSESRLWIWQSSRILDESIKSEIAREMNVFISDWAAHGAKLFAAVEIYFDRFIVLAVDEAKASASGCSIDKMIRFMQNLDQKHNLDLFNRLKVAYRDGEEIIEVSVNEFTGLLKEGKASDDTIVFNNLIDRLDQLQTQWEVPVRKSWHHNLLP